jgi:hypothetical protein
MYKILIRKPEEKRPLGRYRHRGEDTIRMELSKTGYNGMD